MNKPIKKISLILLIVLLLPLLFLSIREILTADENEKLINEIYTNQLEAILFSANQYSEDIVRSWISKFETNYDLQSNKKVFNEKLSKLFAESPSLKIIYVGDSLFKRRFYEERQNVKSLLYNRGVFLDTLIKNNTDVIEKLQRYKKFNFQKIEPVLSNDPELHYLMFVSVKNNFCLFGIDKREFVRKNLSTQIQSIASNQFIVNISDSSAGSIVYGTEQTSAPNTITKNLWLIPEYALGIQLKGGTINEIIERRAKSNIIIFIAFGILMIATAVLAFQNIKKEVELAQIKSDFVSNVSHELRTPLSLISMFAETLEMGRVNSEEKKNEYYKIINSEAGRLSKIVNKILSFSQIEAGKRTYHFSKFCLNDLLNKIKNTYQFHLSNKGFQFNVEIPEKNIFVEGDEESVSEAILNLIDNAVKYSKDEKFVSVNLIEEEKRAVIEVVDKGIGIPKSEQEKIFEKFYRATKGLIHDTKGTGLGLALVKHIVEAHKGNIEIKSELGKGSKFILSFPLYSEG